MNIKEISKEKPIKQTRKVIKGRLNWHLSEGLQQKKKKKKEETY